MLTLWQEGASQPSNVAEVDARSAIDAVEGYDPAATYYNLQGQRVAQPLPGQVVIRLSGNVAAKVLIR